jgi:hypothetical protein
VGLSGNGMPGSQNIPQPSIFDPGWDWFHAEGIPITPLDDAFVKNPYPLMRIVARDALGQLVASTITTVPVSAELQCSMCHASGASPFARPSSGWIFHQNPLKDDRLNILKLHDELEASNPTYQSALPTVGYDPAGMFVTATQLGIPILCSRCHASNALPGTGLPGITPMTEAMHAGHANVVDPSGIRLDDISERKACYTCHPGFDTQCLRGAMGKAIGADGRFAMQCQSCHGSMSAVGRTGRIGWLEQPNCQNCHTGTATQNSGAIRFTSVFDESGNPRVPASDVFATDPDVPDVGFSLYRFSTGHGNLQCSACHGSPHAIYPTSHLNDNLQSQQIQGHVGTLSDCSACHGSLADNQVAGPHGLHPTGQVWVDQHHDVVEHGGSLQCRPCHGIAYEGTVLSYSQGDRTLTGRYGTKLFWRGFQIGCYTCHNGPSSDDPNPNRAPTVPDRIEATPNDLSLPLALSGNDLDGDPLSFRVISQPEHGTVGLIGSTATYFPKEKFLGIDGFTYAAWDGMVNSNLGTITVSVDPSVCPGHTESYGFSCPGSGGFMPLISVAGCPTPGALMTFRLDNGLGGATAYVVAGTSRATLPVSGKCILRVMPLIQTFGPFVLSGSGPGQGSLAVPVRIPPSVTGTITLQGVVFDPGHPPGFLLTQGLELTIQ